VRIAVAGGTGTAGRYAVEAARSAGHQVVVLSRAGGVDVRSGSGLQAALERVEVIVDVLNGGSTGRKQATAFFEETMGNLQVAGAEAGVARMVVLSIVGIDRAEGFAYYDAKRAQEAAARRGPVPVTIVRTTQFHEFAGQLLDRMSFGPLSAVPSMRIRPVAARSVGRHLVEVATGDPAIERSELAGPEEVELVAMAMARRTAKERGSPRMVVPVRIPGSVGSGLRAGALLPGPDAVIAGPGPDEWFASSDVR
jgi:uncharacterized protein YbjT (DUF2867 family)